MPFVRYSSLRNRRSLALAGAIVLVLILLMAMGLRSERDRTPAIPTLTQSQEITLGLKAVPALVARYGDLSANSEQQQTLQRVGQHLVTSSAADKAGWRFTFRLLAEPNRIDAYALPGGQIFITTALFNRMQTEGQLAAVLAHQIAHVTGRHAAKQLKAEGLTAVLVAGEDAQEGAPIDALVSEVVNLTYSTADERAADTEALRIMSMAGYDPNAMLGVLRVLANAYYAGADVAYFTTHPNAADRVAYIQQAIAALYPDGVPESLSE